MGDSPRIESSGRRGRRGRPRRGRSRPAPRNTALARTPRGFFTRYLAEGVTGSLFSTRIALFNTATTPSLALLRFQKSDGTTVPWIVDVPGLTRRTVDVQTIPGLAGAEFSTVIESDERVIVDRTVTWDRSGYGSHAETSVPSPELTWYLAEGATQAGFALFYLLQNPSATAAADVRVTYLLPSGAPLEKTYRVPPATRVTIWVNNEQFPHGSGQSRARVHRGVGDSAGRERRADHRRARDVPDEGWSGLHGWTRQRRRGQTVPELVPGRRCDGRRCSTCSC